MDSDTLGDEQAGSIEFETKDLIENTKGENGKFVWKNIYGCPLGVSNSKYKQMMNEDPDAASQWKGRVLVQCIAEPTEKPLHKLVDIEQEIIDESVQYTENRKFRIICEIGQAVALPSDKKYNVKVTVGGYELIFEPIS